MKLKQVKQIKTIEEIINDGRPELKIVLRYKRFRSNETMIIPFREYKKLKTFFLEPYQDMYNVIGKQVDELKR